MNGGMVRRVIIPTTVGGLERRGRDDWDSQACNFESDGAFCVLVYAISALIKCVFELRMDKGLVLPNNLRRGSDRR